jgi:hypothetical protein
MKKNRFLFDQFFRSEFSRKAIERDDLDGKCPVAEKNFSFKQFMNSSSISQPLHSCFNGFLIMPREPIHEERGDMAASNEKILDWKNPE